MLICVVVDRWHQPASMGEVAVAGVLADDGACGQLPEVYLLCCVSWLQWLAGMKSLCTKSMSLGSLSSAL